MPVPIIHAIKETAAYLRQEGICKVGLEATDGTIHTKVFQQELEANGIQVVLPSEKKQEMVMPVRRFPQSIICGVGFSFDLPSRKLVLSGICGLLYSIIGIYASTAKELLTRAGIKNMDIVKAAVNPSHYWNLVDVGDGWQHFDSTPTHGSSLHPSMPALPLKH